MTNVIDNPTLTWVDGGRVMSGIRGTVTFAWVLLCHLINTPIVPTIVSTPRIVGIGPTHQEIFRVNSGQNSDVIITVVTGLPLHQAQLPVPSPGVPGDPHLGVLRQVTEGQVVDHVPGSYQQRGAVLPEQFEVIGVSVVPNEGEDIVCKWRNIVMLYYCLYNNILLYI